jgi:outer membrane receptor protein involved in Fe transport
MALCLFSVVAIAQTSTTGTIEGSVVDSNGGAVPGITVTVTSPNLIRPQSATTNDEGIFRILNLPPGKYTVSIEATKGFSSYEQRDVDVNLSKTSSVVATLQAAGVGASVDVTASAGSALDTTSNTTGTNVSTEQFSNFPTQRTVQSLYSIAPTATASGLRDASGRPIDPSVGGSSGPENNYILDGVNTTDPAYGGSGANLPFEFVQEVEVKTGAYGAEYGKTTGGIFNVITKSGGNEFHGDVFGYFTTKGLVAATKNFSHTTASTNGFSELDAGFDVGGPIKKDRLWFFGAFNPQRRTNSFLAQTFRTPFQSQVTTPFYAGKLTYSINESNTLSFSTFGDFTKQKGFLYNGSVNDADTGFGADPNSFKGVAETGGSNYTVRLNSTISPTFIGEFAFGLHKQRANIIPDQTVADSPSVLDNFAILAPNGTVRPVTATNIHFANAAGQDLGPLYFVQGAGSFQRNFQRSGFAGPTGLVTNQKRDRFELSARLQNNVGPHTIKYGFEYNRNKYDIQQSAPGGNVTYGNPQGLAGAGADNFVTGSRRVTNNFALCVQSTATSLICPSAGTTARVQALITGGALPGFSVTTGTFTGAQANAAPFLVRNSTRVRDYELVAKVHTDVESFYVQDDFKISRTLQFNLGARWDYQQGFTEGTEYIKLNSLKDNLQPRIGLVWDFTGKGKGKLFANYARFVEAPIPLDVNVRAGGGGNQIDKQFNVNLLNGTPGAVVVPGTGGATNGGVNLGAAATPIDPGLKPGTVNELTGGFEYELARNLTIGARAIYRAQGSVIEDGSFDGGNNYFLFNPGERRRGSTEELACEGPGGCFGRARRYYRAAEFTATKRFANNYQFIASYVFSSLTGNYEGLFRNDNGQADPNITSLFDLPALLTNTYGRLPNDRPHQFKFDGSYTFPHRFPLVLGGSFRAQSGVPFNALIPDPSGVYGNNEGFAVRRGTAINPITGRNRSPSTYNVDLNTYFPVKLGENKQLRFQADFFNVLNSQRAIREDQTVEITTRLAGAPNVPNLFFGNGVLFQFPRALRLGIKFQF